MKRRAARSPLRLAIVAAASIALALVFAQSQSMGLADNGDFTRLMQSVVSRPEAQTINSPPFGTPGYDVRFYKFWIPLWREAWMPRLFSSTSTLLWLPGIAVGNFVHPGVVWLPLVAAGEKAVLVAAYAVFLALFVDGVAPTLFFAVAFGFLLSATDYTVYLNSFYSEGGSGIFFLIFLVAICALERRFSFGGTVLYFAALTLLAASKIQYVYLWPIGFALAFWIVRRAGRLDVRTGVISACLGLAIGIPPICNLVHQSTDLALFQYNDYDRMYDGLLVFADDPRAMLARAGANDPACIGTIAFEPAGIRCAAAHPESLSRASALRVIAADPPVVAHMIGFAADSMQDISLEYLGKYAAGDARAFALPATGPSSWASSNTRDYYTQFAAPPWNAWSALKYVAFPRGWLLLVYFAAAFAFFVYPGRGSPAFAPRVCGASCIVVSFTQLVIAIFGDGREEIVKHLYLANLAFDVSLIAAIAYAAITIGGARARLRRPLPALHVPENVRHPPASRAGTSR